MAHVILAPWFIYFLILFKLPVCNIFKSFQVYNKCRQKASQNFHDRSFKGWENTKNNKTFLIEYLRKKYIHPLGVIQQTRLSFIMGLCWAGLLVKWLTFLIIYIYNARDSFDEMNPFVMWDMLGFLPDPRGVGLHLVHKYFCPGCLCYNRFIRLSGCPVVRLSGPVVRLFL